MTDTNMKQDKPLNPLQQAAVNRMLRVYLQHRYRRLNGIDIVAEWELIKAKTSKQPYMIRQLITEKMMNNETPQDGQN